MSGKPAKRLILRLFGVSAVAALPFAVAAGVGFAADLGGRTAEDAAKVAAVVAPTTDFSKPEPFEQLPAGAATSLKKINRDAFSHPSATLSFEQQMDFRVGNGFFRKIWVSAPASTKSSDGLGPLFNARSCQRCHLKDGRGHPPAANYPDDTAVSMFLRLSIPPRTEAERALIADHKMPVIPEPTYGGQLQDFSIQGLPAEGRMHITYEEVPVELGDGTTVSLRKPSYKVTDLAYGPLHPDTLLSPRVAPAMIGLGLLEMIPEEDLLAHADPDDADGDGISGKPNIVWSVAAQKPMMGRFGWKAGAPSVPEQSAGAFAGDMGLASPLAANLAGDCTEAQTACLEIAPGGADADGFEVPQQVLDLVSFYSRNLAVPARRDIDDAEVLQGKKLFYEAGCTGCHTPKHVTARDEDRPEHSFQLIWPYTDLLLHDMGDGLADGRPEGEANGREWRTAPLWGIGLTEEVSGHTFFLHDGRARSLEEAILWHGGEAAASRDAYAAMARADREALLAFLGSL